MIQNRAGSTLTAAQRPLNRTQIKYIAIFLMLLDHAVSLPGTPYAIASSVHVFGRITAPVMAFFIAEGYRHTRDVRKYLLRLAVFALISAVPFRLFESHSVLPFEMLEGAAHPANSCTLYLEASGRTFVYYRGSVITTLFLGLLAIVLWDRAKLNVFVKLLLTALICRLADLSDWSCWMVLYCLAFYFAGDDKVLKWTLFAAVSCMYAFNLKFSGFGFSLNPAFQTVRLGVFLAVPLLQCLYSGEPGAKTAVNRWFFYVFYPAHLLGLCLIRTLL